MKQIIYIITGIAFVVLLASYTLVNNPTSFFNIPAQTINLYKIIGVNTTAKEHTVKSFNISELISYKEYKTFLNDTKNDSSIEYYQTLLPDSNIGSIEIRNKYIKGNAYDNLPVLGISWDNAMNFCRWKTLKENKDSIQFIYRLPIYSEWLAAYFYLSQNKIKNDFNQNYSDWLINSKSEVCYN
ncbi:MAG: SUMF1/EgtB/PvdO family nonheme iron enzyme, partial [Bacteroidia bacterium]